MTLVKQDEKMQESKSFSKVQTAEEKCQFEILFYFFNQYSINIQPLSSEYFILFSFCEWRRFYASFFYFSIFLKFY